MTVLVGVLAAIGMIVVVPLGLRLMDPQVSASPLVPLWPAGGAFAALSLVVERGPFAVGLTVPYAALTVWLAVLAAVRFSRNRSLAPTEIAVLTAMVAPAVAAGSLVADRGGYHLLGFDLDVLALTVVHFHFAGFAAALIAGLTTVAAPGVLSRTAAVSVPAGIGLVFAGYFVGDQVELIGAAVLTTGMWMLAWVLWHDVRELAGRHAARIMLSVAATVLLATMALALWWAAGEMWEFDHPSLAWMAATHGVANALGFALCGLLAWRRLHAPAGAPSTAPAYGRSSRRRR